MASVWTRLEADVSLVTAGDGEQSILTPAGGTPVVLPIFWEGDSVDGGEIGGPRAWCATADLPSGTITGGSLVYPATNGTTYTVATRNDDGHGMTLLVVTDETEL